VVSSTGTLDTFNFSATASGHVLSPFKTIRIPDIGEDILFLSFAWHPSLEDVVAISTSEGNIYILRLGKDYETSQTSDGPIIQHSLEAWCVAMTLVYPDQTGGGNSFFTLMTGGDDSALQYLTCSIGHDSLPRGSLQVELPFSPVTVRGHSAGVTAILFLPLPSGEQPDLVVTGSYDDRIRIYSFTPLHLTSGLRKATLMAEANLGGGVWRLKLIRIDNGGEPASLRAWVLASCMHAGARLVELRRDATTGSWEIHVLARFEEHKSMNYASDCQPAKATDDLVCVSSSFYDKLLCVWKFRGLH
jgi:diphthamide biosynthesis protein 7